mgnify:CR=1 FL=1
MTVFPSLNQLPIAQNVLVCNIRFKHMHMEDSIIDDDFFSEERPSIDQAQLATFWQRLGAQLVDFMILFPIMVINLYNTLNIKSLGIMILLTTASALYKPYLEWQRSATFGKSFLGIKLVDEQLDNISMEQAFKRYFPWVISFLFSLYSNVFLFMSPEFADIDDFMQIGYVIQQAPLSGISNFYGFVFIVLVGSLVFDVRKQGIHDKAAGTYCIVDK